MLPEYFVVVGVVIGSIGVFSYLIDTLKGRVKPNRVSFLLWSIAPLIAFFAQFKQGVGIQSLMTLAVGVQPLIILAATFINKKAEWKLTKFDLFCGALSIVGLILWQITQIGDLAIAFGILADGLAALPTIVKAYRYPETETVWPWLAASASGFFTALTITNWNFATFGFPIYIFFVNFLIFAIVYLRTERK